MSNHEFHNRVLDARPDRIDFRDRSYAPPLVSLPPSFPSEEDISRFLPVYHKTSKILDQGREGACTGFGLAAVINYTRWDHWLRENDGDLKAGGGPTHVSPWMLYDNARVYDEWEGEDYSGSSCRGAMKGWHKHGVCREELWQKRTRNTPRPAAEWSSDAALCPLGAYYRVDARSISDMQAAIREVRAVYCSARVHAGWWLEGPLQSVSIAGLDLPLIELHQEITGGHAFAIVGYTPYGFIVQNSWGQSWGMKGFALLTYDDWAINGDDAWVAAIAAPMRVASKVSVPAARSRSGLELTSSTLRASAEPTALRGPWSEARAYEHSVVMGNDGKVLRRLVDTSDPADNLRKVVFELPEAAIESGKRHILLYAHGGLNSEEAAISRARHLGPWFDANGIHPIFIVWRTSLMESIGQIGQDIVGQFLEEREEMRARGIGDLVRRAIDKLQNKFDNAFEAAAEKVLGKAVWSQMKQNAQAAANGDGGTRQVTNLLHELGAEHSAASFHMLGHSAGSILLGHMLDDMRPETRLRSVGLYAPACSLRFATRHFGGALRNGVLAPGQLHVDNLTDENERDDTVGPYGKSLLYLVSRAFEDPRKMPLMGFAKCWDPGTSDLKALKKRFGADFADGHVKDIRDWDQVAGQFGVGHKPHKNKQVVTKTSPAGDEKIKIAHGSFDNDLAVVNRSVARVLDQDKPAVKITNLVGF